MRTSRLKAIALALMWLIAALPWVAVTLFGQHPSRRPIRRTLAILATVLLAGFIALTLARGAVAQEASLSLDPSSGLAGTVAQAVGDGFFDSGCVEIRWESPAGPVLSLASVGDGSFSASITIPGDATLGDHAVIAQGLLPGEEFCGGPSGQEAEATFTVTQPGIEGPFVVGEPVTPYIGTINARDLPTAEPWEPGDPVIEPPQHMESELGIAGSLGPQGLGNSEANGELGIAGDTVELASASATTDPLSPPAVNFEGIGFTGVAVPDTVGDVGPDHYVQAVNKTQFAVYDKQGNLQAGPTAINQMWAQPGVPATDPCRLKNGGDVDVKYDPLADRWLLSQFTGAGVSDSTFNQCIAISQTPDPTGTWFLYTFPMVDQHNQPIKNDYPKIGVWPDAYYMGSQEGYPAAADVWAFDRANMVVGGTARPTIRFRDPGTFMLPSDLDGATLPPAGAPNVFLRFVDGEQPGAQFGGVDRLELRAFHVDWNNPANSTFTALPDLPTAIDRHLCGWTLYDDLNGCIPQPGTTQHLGSWSATPMYRLQYRNFGTRETLVVNHTVDVDGTDHAGVRWYELRRGSDGAWSISQQGTYAPDATHRWMGSVAMDGAGNIALGYSVSSSTVFPGVRYTGRLASDPLGTMPQGEQSIIGGAASLTWTLRWGDYSAMSVDPVDDCTFWYTQEYVRDNTPAYNKDGQLLGTGTWGTRIAAFSFPTCKQADVKMVSHSCSLPAGATDVSRDVSLECAATVHNNGPSGPVDAEVRVDVVAPPDCTVTPSSVSVPALLDVSVDETVLLPPMALHCAQPSSHQLEYTSTVGVTDPDLVDPDPANNSLGPTALPFVAIGRADVKITSWDVPPVRLVLSEQVFFRTLKSLHNNGPFGPVDVDVGKTVDVPPDMEGSVHVTQPGGERVTVPPGVRYRIIDPAGSEVERGDGGLDRHLGPSHVVKVVGGPGGPELSVHFEVPGLPVSVGLPVEEEFDLHCLRPGRFLTRLTNEIQPTGLHVTDPDAGNNIVERDVAAVCIEIDIKPGSYPNSINIKSSGTIPVAILSSPSFDASSEVDLASLTFGRTGDEDSLAFCSPSPADVNGDGLLDRVCHFNTQDTGLQCGDTRGVLRGRTTDGVLIEGRDSLRIVPCR